MKTVTFEWEDGVTSYESFENEDQVWEYVRETEKETGVSMKDWTTDSISMMF